MAGNSQWYDAAIEAATAAIASLADGCHVTLHTGTPPAALRLHELENCWCGWHHEMRWASDIGWDTLIFGDRLIMTTDEPRLELPADD
jgi:hypothetical protein